MSLDSDRGRKYVSKVICVQFVISGVSNVLSLRLPLSCLVLRSPVFGQRFGGLWERQQLKVRDQARFSLGDIYQSKRRQQKKSLTHRITIVYHMQQVLLQGLVCVKRRDEQDVLWCILVPIRYGTLLVPQDGEATEGTIGGFEHSELVGGWDAFQPCDIL